MQDAGGNPNPEKIPLRQGDIFGVPTWISSIPEFVPYHAQVIADLKARWDAGEFGHSKFGYGYQTPTELFKPEYMEAKPHMRILREAFEDRCHRILARRKGYAEACDYEISDIQAWARLQVKDEERFPWHHHIPATISACYYVHVPEVPDGEGELQFENPVLDDFLRPPMFTVKPKTGDFILFPSYLFHRPTPTPSATEWRVNINMDLYLGWRR